MESSPHTPSPARTRTLSEKLKRALLHLLFISSAASATFTPFLAAASFFSLGSLIASAVPTANAAEQSYNSQTLPILAPATNIDPSPAVGGGDISVVGGQALMAAAGPEGTAADIADDPQSTAISVYTVHQGDTLASIAKMYGVSVNTIVWANNLTGSIHEGDQLIILPISGIQYTVKSGDTLASIAKKYSADAIEIAQFNNLSVDSALNVGDTLIIPNGEAAAPASAAKPKPASAGSAKKAGTIEPYLGGSGPAIPGYYSWPLAGGVITQGLHGWNAVDIGAPKGTSIYAAAAGTVIVSKNNGAWNGGYGNYVVVSHPNGTQTLYAHMTTTLVSVGAHVSQGQTIGKVGSTGESTGPHLHFEVRGAANPFAN